MALVLQSSWLNFFYFVIAVCLTVAFSMVRRVLVFLFVGRVLYLYEECFGIFLLLTAMFLRGVAFLCGLWWAVFLVLLRPLSVLGRVLLLCVTYLRGLLYERCFPLYVVALLSLVLILLWFS